MIPWLGRLEWDPLGRVVANPSPLAPEAAIRCPGERPLMNRADRKRRTGACSLADIGALTVAWMPGDLDQTT